MKTITVLSCVILKRVNVKLPLHEDVGIQFHELQAFKLPQQTHPQALRSLQIQTGDGAQTSETSCGTNEQFIEFVLAVIILVFLVWTFHFKDKDGEVKGDKNGKKIKQGQAARAQNIRNLRVQVPDASGKESRREPRNDVDYLKVDRKLNVIRVNVVLVPTSNLSGFSVQGRRDTRKQDTIPRVKTELAKVVCVQSPEGIVVPEENPADLAEKVRALVHAEPVNAGNVSVVFNLHAKNKTNNANEYAEIPFALFKPYGLSVSSLEEDFGENNKKMSTKEQILNEVCAYELDHAVSDLDLSAGVPQTELATFPKKLFNVHDTTLGEVSTVSGSLQAFVKNSESCEDYGPSLFSLNDVHKIGILDLRILNCDRHSGNLLLVNNTKEKAGSDVARTLVPIDHALAFPSAIYDSELKLSDVSFEWLMFPQAKQPFNDGLIKAIAKIDAQQDWRIMETLGMSFGQKLAVSFSTKLLQIGAVKYGKTLYELGSIIQRDMDRTEPSIFETLVFKVLNESSVAIEEANFLRLLLSFEKVANDYFLDV